MLLQLNIKNFALIQELTAEFGEGFNILSGETGAGKSILIDAIDYVLGGKFSKNLIRHGEEKTIVEAIFSIENEDLYDVLEECGIEKDELVIISRETTLLGKSIVKVNGKAIVISQLKKIREKLLDIHGQHQNQNLLHKGNHIIYLDEFIGNDMTVLLEKFNDLKIEHSATIKRIQELVGTEDRDKLLDYIKFQIEDIQKANLKNGEEENLKEQFNVLSNAEKISKSLKTSYGILSENMEGTSIIDGLSKVVSELSFVEEHLDKIKEKKEVIEGAFYNLEEATRDLRDLLSEIYYDEDELAKVNERIYEISIYKKKYGDSIDEILKHQDKLSEQYEELMDSENVINELQSNQIKLEEKMREVSSIMNELRSEKGLILEKAIKDELTYVGLEKAIIKIQVDILDSFNDRGLSDVSFLVSANPGEPLKPLEKVLSGGELSRIMLALKCVFVDKDKIPTLIFDEIDTGISGIVAKRVGEKMYEVSTKHQVLCITHLPQIAVLSDCHYFVSKEVKENKTFTKIRTLNRKDKTKEIAKMMGGDEISDVTMENSSEMISLADVKKEQIREKFKL